MATTKKQNAKVGKVMKEYKEGTLHSGKGGPVVKSQKQAVAIAMSEANMPKRGQRTAKNKMKKSK
jgi:ribosomal protein L21E